MESSAFRFQAVLSFRFYPFVDNTLRLMLITFFVTIVTWYQALETQQYFEAALCVEVDLLSGKAWLWLTVFCRSFS